mmetsp:Transcript_8954/g.17897  ORF Transcript_8954/g.17897 Transcript_8954/m.17897 type:complete len:112 (-) Transcript_8954:344-679(-)
MCIHEIDKNRGTWQHTFHTRKHSYLVSKKYMRVIPAAASMHFYFKQDLGKLSPDSTPGFVVLAELSICRLQRAIPPRPAFIKGDWRRQCIAQQAHRRKDAAAMSRCTRSLS